MSAHFTRAVRQNVGLIIGLSGGTGSGKTMSAMRLAAGIAGDKPFAVVDTENKRALHYADRFGFDHCDLRAPFTPGAYAQMIKEADAEGYPVILVDSMSHEHSGDGGLLEMQQDEWERLGGKDGSKMLSWVKPKTEHRKMMTAILSCRAHVILCFRAEEKIEIVKDEHGKSKIQPKKTLTGLDGWVPVCEKTIPYEATCSFLMTSDKPGIPKPIKLQEQHRHLFPLDKPITEESGKALAAWASSGADDVSKPLRDAKTLEELAAAWGKLSPTMQALFRNLKDKRKTELSNGGA